MSCERESTPPSVMCPDPVPAFRLTLSSDMPLPEGLALKVSFGGAQFEQYVLGEQGSRNETVCCISRTANQATPERIPCGGAQATSERDAADLDGADAGNADLGSADLGSADLGSADPGADEFHQIVCDLWTNASAVLNVRAAGHAPLERFLGAERDEALSGCDAFLTLAVDISLSHPDAGM